MTAYKNWTKEDGGGGGTIQSIAISNTSGFYGSVDSPTGPNAVLNLKTSVTGILKGDGIAVVAAEPADFISSNVLSLMGNVLTSIVNGVESNPVTISSSGPITNSLVNNGDNTLTSNVSGNTSTTDIITITSLLLLPNSAQFGVNGYDFPTATFINSLTLSLTGTSLSLNANGIDSNSINVQPLIPSPTANNLVAVDINGVVIDSGIAVSSSPMSNDNAHVPTTAAMQSAIAAAIGSPLHFVGTYDASTNLFPSVGSGSGGAVRKGDFWSISVAGTLGGRAVSPGDTLLALIDAPGQTSTNWTINSASVTANALNLVGNALTSAVNGVNSNTINIQIPISSPTNNNLVSMDNNGYVKDSGISVTTDNTSNDNTHVPTTAAVQTNLALKAPLANPIFTGSVTVPLTVNSTDAARKDYVDTGLALKAPLSNPVFTGHVNVPTPTNSSDAATKAYVDAGLATKINSTTGTAIQKADGAGGLTAAISGTDYQPIIPSPTANNLVSMTGAGVVQDAGAQITTSSASNDNTHVPTTAAMQSAISTAITSSSSFRPGGYDASSNLFPSTGGSGSSGAIRAGDYWIITVAGTLGGTAVLPNDSLQSLINAPGQTSSNWVINGAVTKTYVDTQLAGKEPTISILPVVKGGTGLNTYTPGDLIVATANTTLSTIAAPAIGRILISTGVATPPVFSPDPVVGTIKLTSLTSQLILGVSPNTMTFTMATLTGARIFTLPDANCNPVQPSSAPSNQFATGISSAGVISYSPLTNTLSSSVNTMTSTVSGVSSNQPIINSHTLSIASTTLTDTVNGVSATAQVAPSPQSITSSINFTNLDEIIVLVAPLLNAVGFYKLLLKDGSGNELDILFSISGNQNTGFNQSSMDIIKVNDSQGVITATNISSYLLFRGYVRTDSPNSYFALTMSMPYSLIYTNPLSLTASQDSFSYLTDNTTITAMVTTNISNLVSTAAPNLSFKMKLNVVQTSVSSPQGYLYETSNTNVIFQWNINLLAGTLSALSPASVAMTTPYKIVVTNNRNYLYASTSGGTTIFMWRISPTNGTLSALTPASITTPSLPTGMAVDPTDRFLYACFDTAAVIQMYTITKGTGVLVFGQSVGAIAGMRDCVVHSSGKFLYAFSASGTVVYQFAINPSTGFLTAIGTGTVTTGTTPLQMSLHPNGKYLYVACSGGTTVYMYAIDQVTGALTPLSPATFTMASNPFGVTVHPNGNYIFVCLSVANQVVQCLINPATGLIVATGPNVTVNGARHSCFDYTGSYLYVINTTNNRVDTYAINSSTGAFTANGNVAGGTNANGIFAA